MKNRLFAVVFALMLQSSLAVEVRNAWSPENRDRPQRASTLYIVLHTTEAPLKSALAKIRERGEAHFVVDTAGVVYRTVERDRIAYHAGRSMWDGQVNVDTCSIGIEVVGNYNREPTREQFAALRELLVYLKEKYSIPDERVLTHSMVAYGAPNRWHKQSHRGRKRCGMMFAVKWVRRSIGLQSEPLSDPDVKAGRLVSADPLLARVLYGKESEQEVASVSAQSMTNVVGAGRSVWDIARDAFDDPGTVYILPNGERLTGDKVADWSAVPSGTVVLVRAEGGDSRPEGVRSVGRQGVTPRDVAGEEHTLPTTVYFLPDGRMRYGAQIGENPLALGTRVLVGYRYAGAVTDRKSAFEICGGLWRSPQTYYRMPGGELVSGSAVSEKSIPRNAMIFTRN
jgi:hypothetical protein